MTPVRQVSLLTILLSIFYISFHPPFAGEYEALTAAEEEMLAQLDTLWTSGERELTLAKIDSLVLITSSEQDPLFRLQLLRRQGARLIFFGRPRLAEQQLREALELAEAHGDTLLLCTTMRWLGVSLGRQGRAAESLDYYNQLQDLAHASGDTMHEGWALIGIGYYAQREANDSKAMSAFERAAILLRDAKDAEGEIWALNSMGMVVDRKGDSKKALEYFRRAMKTARESNEQMAEALALNNIGTIEYRLGDPRLALRSFQQAYDLHMKLGSQQSAITPGINIALCQSELYRLDEAEEILQSCLQVCRDIGYRTLEAAVLKHLARLSNDRKQYNNAIRIYSDALAMGDALSFEEQIIARTGTALAMIRINEHENALDWNGQALELLDGRQDHPLWAETTLQRGECLLALGRTDEALEYLLTGTRAAQAQGMHNIYTSALCISARATRLLGRREQTAALLDEAETAWESSRKKSEDPEWRQKWGEYGRLLYAELPGLLLSDEEIPVSDRLRETFNRLQRFKARTLQERMQGQARADSSNGSDSFITLDQLKSDVLNPGELFLDAYVGNLDSYIFAVTKDTCYAAMIPKGSDLEDPLKRYYDLISKPPTASSTDEPVILTAVASELRKLLLSDLSQLIATNDRILFSTDFTLALVPFTTLQEESDDSVKEWVRVPSATILAILRSTSSPYSSAPVGAKTREILAIAAEESADGQKLPGAVAEVKALAKKFRNVKTLIIAPGESVPGAKELQEARLLHIASHLEWNNQRPWQSKIYFGPADTASSISAAEIADLKLNADLAVLSSCASAKGWALSAEGVVALSSALLTAGVPAILATLWPVDDATTADFMDYFYNSLGEGESIAASAAQAQQRIRAKPETSHPFFWAGFIVVGDGAIQVPLEKRSLIPGWGIVLLAVVVLGLLLSAWRIGRRRTRG